MSQASISSSTNQYESRQAELIKACVSGRVQLVRQLLSATSISSTSGGLNAPWTTAAEKDTLRIALQRAAGRGNLEIVQLLLAQGAEVEPKHDSKKGDEVGSLFRAAENGFTDIVEELLARGANPENARDRFGRLALTIAALSGFEETVFALLKSRAFPDSRDKEGRTVLLYLAWDKQYAFVKQPEEKNVESKAQDSPVKQPISKQSKKQPAEKQSRALKTFPLNEKILNALIAAGADLDARDSTQRTPLIWASVNGKIDLVRFLLEASHDAKFIVDASNDKGRTALHFASESGFDAIVELLLRFQASPRIASEGGWTALHNAAQKGHANIVFMLLNAGASVNAALSNGKTALHWASQNGHKDVVEKLLQRMDTRLFVKDSYERTPIICAAENGHDDIVQMLSPSKTGDRLSPEARYACNHFKATVVDFGLDGQPREKTQRVLDHSVFDLLYGWDPIHQREKVPSQVKNVHAKPAFRWIHIPHNNVAWAEAMLTKAFVESGNREIAEFKALEKCFGQEHRGSTAHASFMRTFSQRIQPLDYRHPTVSSTEKSNPPEVLQEENPFGIVPTPAIRVEPSTPMVGSLDTLDEKDSSSGPGPSSKKKKGDKASGKKSQKGEEVKKQTGQVNGKNTPNKKQGDKGKDQKQQPKQTTPAGKVVLFMPYLHYETDLYRSRMNRAITRAQTLNPLNPDADAPDPIQSSPDDMLIKAYLNVHSTDTQPGLHPRRTLDQFFYHGIDTSVRDQDQVVYRYCQEKKIELKVFMVDQLWMWILGKDLIVTCFPQRWQQPPNDPLNVLKGIIEDIDVKANKQPVKSVYDLAMLITNRCSGIFDRHRLDDINYQFIEMFESSLGHLTNEETRLFDRFNTASGKATRWLREHRRSRARRVLMGTAEDGESLDDPSFVDNLLDIRRETAVLLEIKDIQDELSILKKVLQNQIYVLPDFAEHIADEQGSKRSPEATEVRKKSKEQVKVIEEHIKELTRMDKQAEQIYKSLGHLLDLKQKHANAFEARFARDQAALTARQGQTIMVFTIVTIVFLPMSFIAAVFAINVNEFPHDPENDQQSMPFNYLAKWMFGIGFGISIPLIIIAFAVDDVVNIFRRISIKVNNFFTQLIKKSKTSPAKRLEDHEFSIASNEKVAAFAIADYDRQSRSSYGGVGAYRRDFSPLSDRSLGRGSSVVQSQGYNQHHVHFDRSSMERPRSSRMNM